MQTSMILLSVFLPKRGKVLVMHSIGQKEDNYNLDIGDFEQLLDKLEGVKCIKAKDVLKSKDFVCLTFDDVRESFYTNAYPLLKQKEVPFTIFVATNLIGEKGYLDKEKIVELSKDPLCEVGSHSVSHCRFAAMDRSEKNKELFDSKTILSEITGKNVVSFAFPYGSYTACGLVGKNTVKKYYDFGFSTMGFDVTYPSIFSSFFIPRINVDKNYIERYHS